MEGANVLFDSGAANRFSEASPPVFPVAVDPDGVVEVGPPVRCVFLFRVGF